MVKFHAKFLNDIVTFLWYHKILNIICMDGFLFVHRGRYKEIKTGLKSCLVSKAGQEPFFNCLPDDCLGSEDCLGTACGLPVDCLRTA